MHSRGISCIYRKGSMGFVDLYFNCLVSCIVLQFYYRHCNFKIIYNQLWNCVHKIGNVLRQPYFNPYNISCFKAFLQKGDGFGNKVGHVEKLSCHIVFLVDITTSLISTVQVLSWDIPLFERHFIRASIEAWNNVTLCQILASSWNATLWYRNCHVTWCITGDRVWLNVGQLMVK